MEPAQIVENLRQGVNPGFPPQATQLEYAQLLDSQDELRPLREKFIIPSKTGLSKRSLAPAQTTSPEKNLDDSIYLCGNSLGLQPRATKEYLQIHLDTWADLGVHGHFTTLQGSPLVQWQSIGEVAAAKSSKLVGASPGEVVIMNNLTSNLHLMLASFYKPTPTKNKIIMEWRSFPSDHASSLLSYAVESQIRWHGFDPAESMVLLKADEGGSTISTQSILAAIDKYAEETALVLLPGIQYYSGQFLDIATITKHAQSYGIPVGWDLAHAVGNVELHLHDWNVDFAVWCNYKYINAGPGAIGGAFVHERHGTRDYDAETKSWKYRPRLTGWYGGDKSVRFNMDNEFMPTLGAAGYQLSTTSVVELASLMASLSVFDETSMSALRTKSLLLTGYLEYLLDGLLREETTKDAFQIITPRDPRQRGVQLSVRFRPGLLEPVSKSLSAQGVVADQRKPDVMRLAPVPLYNSFKDVWTFVQMLRQALTS
ncbi:kynureninase [Capronia epimyces CBS 606.96]|uniref:Kynureninase n=1 Tax=Capronia epimyces CBS 606.96 TaxID=1182542 RepID=W9XPM5_9EURO|nr:kynureninase [Capronia epimyces CBS 606.96]EXJ78906.1 kynureninase [Capronia epimyces CBS 606.96]